MTAALALPQSPVVAIAAVTLPLAVVKAEPSETTLAAAVLILPAVVPSPSAVTAASTAETAAARPFLRMRV